MEYHNRAFGAVLRDLRKQKGLSQEALGFEAELTRNYISLLECGDRSPTLDTMLALCSALDISLAHLATAIQARIRENHDRNNPS
ncbi:helix-turn-helix domain-containing protein [Chromobacterium piscinae]|uniref:helix-turn-helix domain-containing protein n=1 Tax=Chromobacterium piscinae TaxID=686831 RepID=UPI001E52BFB1|nr:helix-turn-helix transcriptional regulator [Chromobacterium piscinae]MCD5327848.1 helix-turn-helix domain-containing protein [Chromobacterium piscinae]